MQQVQFHEALDERLGVYLNPEIPENGPSPATIAHVGQVELFVLMGPSAIGKNTQKVRVIEAIGRSAGGLAIAEIPSITTRPEREEEKGPEGIDPYLRHYNTDDPKDQDDLMGLFDNGQIVQGFVHPDTGFFYGSVDKSYAVSTPGLRIVNLADFMIENYVELYEQQLFGEQYGAYLTAHDNDQWADQWGIRDRSKGLDYITDRLAEADRSTSLCLHAENDVARRSIRIVAHDYSDVIDPTTGMTETTTKLASYIRSPETYDDLDDRPSLGSMQSYIRGMERGVRLAQHGQLIVVN